MYTFLGHIPRSGIAGYRTYKCPASADIGEQTPKVVVSIYTPPAVYDPYTSPGILCVCVCVCISQA